MNENNDTNTAEVLRVLMGQLSKARTENRRKKIKARIRKRSGASPSLVIYDEFKSSNSGNNA